MRLILALFGWNNEDHFAGPRQLQLFACPPFDFFGIPLEGTHHRGHDDAYNIARLMVHLLDTFSEEMLLPYWDV